MSEDADKAAPVVDAVDKPKSGGGVKPRKSGGKKGAAADDQSKYEYGDIVLARLRGYPPWPARVTDPEALPANVLALRPKSQAFHCTQFFPVGDYAWLPPKDIQHLRKHQIQAFLSDAVSSKRSAGQLREAYETALDPSDWDKAHQEMMREREEAEADEDVDELEEEEGPAAKGKRKRVAPAPKKEAKKAKTTKKDEPKSKAEKPKSKTTDKPADETKSEGQAAGDEETPDPEAVKVKDWRHKLQRAFLQKGVPTAAEMDQYDELFKTIENYGDMKIEYLQYSKIGKVMKKIAALTNVPRDDEFKITSRAEKLMKEWTDFISRSEGGGAGANGSTANGSADKADSAPAPVSAPAPEAPAADATPAADGPAPAAPAATESAATESASTDAAAPAPEPAAAPEINTDA